jgi:hypothetical protein
MSKGVWTQIKNTLHGGRLRKKDKKGEGEDETSVSIFIQNTGRYMYFANYQKLKWSPSP